MKFANLMIKVENQSDLKKKKKLPTSNSDCRNPSFGLATKAKGIARVRAKRKPGSQGKRKPGSHITYSREC